MDDIATGGVLILSAMLIAFFSVAYFLANQKLNFLLAFTWGCTMYALGYYQKHLDN